MFLILTAIFSFTASCVTTRALIPWLRRRGAVATENSRTMHSGAIPKGGGLPLLASAAVALLTVAGPGALDKPLAIGALTLAALSWRDDTAPLPAIVRFPVHIACATLFVLSLPASALVFQGWLPLWADRAVTILALAWMTNLYNFMDGINGIAGVETLAVTAGYLLVGYASGEAQPFDTLSAALFGASAGFLVWNLRKRALVFMGDAGSVPLGFLMGALSIDLAVRGAWAAGLILPAYFLADATLTLLKRIARGEKPWEAHRSHFYQRAAAAWGSHLKVIWLIVIADVVLMGCAALSIVAPWAGLGAGAVCLAALLAALDR